MGQIFTLDPKVVTIMEKSIDDLILYLGKDCKVVYPPKITPCPNCVRDPVGNKSKNIYLHGGPMPFPMGSICPLCDGSGNDGSLAEEISEVIRVIVHWNPKKYMNTQIDNLRLNNGVISIKGHIVDMPKIQRMSYFIPHIDIAGYANYRFRLSGEPVSAGNIVQSKFFVALLDRVAG